MKRELVFVLAALCAAGAVYAHPPSGAIFTTLPDGSEVNRNIFQAKEDVYLDGGPGPGAPASAAGLDDGTYVFQVTDPPGKKLLSTDEARCREFTVVGGLITGVVPAGGCEHVTGIDIDHGATTVQLMPYLDTPNHGGEYKAWAVLESDFLAGCMALGENDGLNVVDCGSVPGNLHGFVPGHTKTDNFKIRNPKYREIDTRFIDDSTGALMDGFSVTWNDPLGSSNVKWSYENPALEVRHWAHVEVAEPGVHRITVQDQPGCKVQSFSMEGGVWLFGPGTIEVTVKNGDKVPTNFLYVHCETTQ